MENAVSPMPSAADKDGSTQTPLEALLNVPDLSLQVSCALEEALTRLPGAEKVDFLQRSAFFGAHLQRTANYLRRQLVTSSNSASWPLSDDLTIKIFSQLGMHSLCQAAAACSLFNKVAMEAACYRDIDLTDINLSVDNCMIANLVNRAGRHLRSLKLGMHVDRKKEIRGVSSVGKGLRKADGNSLLTKFCLWPLLVSVANGTLLQTLHLQNIEALDTSSVCKVIPALPCLLDLEIIGIRVNTKKFLQTVSSCCHELTRLCIESPNMHRYILRTSSCHDIVEGCPKISSLSFRGFTLSDKKVNVMLKGLHQLLEVDFSGADMLRGTFFRKMVSSGDLKLRSLKLCDCISLKAVEVNRLLSSLISGECKSLRHLDVCIKDGLATSNFDQRSHLNKDAVSLLHMERPEFDLRAVFTDEESNSESESAWSMSSFVYFKNEFMDVNCPSEVSSIESSESWRCSKMIDPDIELDSEDDDDGNFDDYTESEIGDDVEFNLVASNDFKDDEDYYLFSW